MKHSTSGGNLSQHLQPEMQQRLDSLSIPIDSAINNDVPNNGDFSSDVRITLNKNGRLLEPLSRDAMQTDASISIAVTDDIEAQKKKSMKRNTSLISFKSLDLHIKSIYSGLRNKSSPADNQQVDTQSRKNSAHGSSVAINRKPPYVKVETVDQDESENLLLTYPQSPYQHRGSFDKSSSQLLAVSPYEVSRSQAGSPFLCPSPGNIRRSSTSDIMSKKSNISSSVDSRRPSTSSLLRRARERKGSESGRLGRSTSHGGLPRGGCRGGRRTSMAF